jgi:uncharacterized 2Fe-2S/4Fe-4S cluster protein (DUF4445 family)
MANHQVRFNSISEPVVVPTGTLLSEAAKSAGVDIYQPCGGQGRCGRCVVQIQEGFARQRSTLRLKKEDIDAGYALACQTVIEGDIVVYIPPQERIERILTTDRTVAEVNVPEGYVFDQNQSILRVHLKIDEPSLEDQTDDLNRVKRALRREMGFDSVEIRLPLLRRLGGLLRENEWEVTALMDFRFDRGYQAKIGRLIDLLPGQVPEQEPIWGAAIDIGTTTVTIWLVDLVSGQVKSQVSEYNTQISRGEDVISRIIYAGKGEGGIELSNLILGTIEELLQRACKRVGGLNLLPTQIVKLVVSGNSTMMHLLLNIPPSSIRLSPFITAVNHPPILRATEVGINIHPEGIIECLPGVASYVGADITAGVYSSTMNNQDPLTLFMDVGTNGEIVLGNREWLVTCACSAGPAFEGAGVVNGMRATKGAIEEVWIDSSTYEPSYRVIGGGLPRGICGSGLISLLAEMFITGVIDKGGNIDTNINSSRIRLGDHGLEYVVAWSNETDVVHDIVITKVDIDNLLRAKGAIFAGYQVLAERVGVPLEIIDQMFIGGSFGKYINIEKAVQIGLLPDLPWERFKFLGNTSVLGSYFALLDANAAEEVREIANRMTYIELSSDNAFYEKFMSALFLPHTDMSLFPSIAEIIKNQ